MPATDLALLREAAQAAGRIALSHWKAAPEGRQKPGGEGPVTDADLAIDRMLRAELTAARPDYGWLSEESEDDPARLAAGRVFIVDPIDGTRAFIAGEAGFAQSLAVAEAGRITAAVVYLPARGTLYAATAEVGATRDGRPLSVTRRADLDGADILVRRSHLDPAHWPAGVPQVTRHHRPALAYRLCLVAEGRCDGLVTLRETWEWDTAAGTLIVAEAGGTVTDRHGTPLRFNTPGARHAGIVAGGPGVQAALCARLA